MTYPLPILPNYISILFFSCCFLCLGLLIDLLKNSSLKNSQLRLCLILLIVYLNIQSVVTLSGFYHTNLEAVPPRFILVVLPAIVLIAYVFISQKGRSFIMSLHLQKLSFLSILRIPVELSLLSLFVHKAIPIEMTFEGYNYDIISGITAIFISWYAFKGQKIRKTLLWIWNILALGLLITIVGISIFSTPSNFQIFGLEQANVAILNFPYVLLPCFIVPVVFFTHLASIYQLIHRK